MIDKTHEKYVEQMTWPANGDFGRHLLPKTSGKSKPPHRQKENKLPKLGETKGGLLTLSGIVLIALLYLVKEAERKKRRN
ncbi:LPXTG cell wall anchor domain-containing protein [Enterococcus hirae]|nr:LPXTG cell wall anchor domain-containing protein [Enterococcus hirae]